MVSNVFPGHSFYHAGRYVLRKAGAEVLDTEGVRGYDFKLMADDFDRQNNFRASKTQACFHAALSFYPGEDPGDELMVRIAREYLELLNITNTQFAIIKHTDKAHLHLHVLANMVDYDGKAIEDSWIGLRGKKAAQKLTRKYQLIPADGKHLNLTHLEALSESELNRYKIYQAIVDSLPFCQTLRDLELRLMAQGIHTQYKYKRQSQELQGISFRIGKDRFKGSQIDRKFSLGNLQKTLNRQQLLAHKIKTKPSLDARKKAILTRTASSKPKPSNPAPNYGQVLSPLVAALLRPVQSEGGTPYELTDAYRKKKKKKRRPSL